MLRLYHPARTNRGGNGWAFRADEKPRWTALGKFVYGKSYLARNNTVEIDPIELKLSDETFETTRLRGLFGALRDAAPNSWGQRVIEKHSGKTMLGELDYLLESPDDRAGALSFGLGQEPPAPRRTFNKTLELAKLQGIADAIVRDEVKEKNADAVQVEELMLIGTSMGGARPKTVVEDDQGLWIAKFNRADDRWNSAKVEHAMLELAKKCGISAAESRVTRIRRRRRRGRVAYRSAGAEPDCPDRQDARRRVRRSVR